MSEILDTLRREGDTHNETGVEKEGTPRGGKAHAHGVNEGERTGTTGGIEILVSEGVDEIKSEETIGLFDKIKSGEGDNTDLPKTFSLTMFRVVHFPGSQEVLHHRHLE